MNNADTATHKPYTYVMMVKGANGRAWYRADSAQFADMDLVAKGATDAQVEYPHLRFMATNEIAMIARPIAPAKYRPWDTTPDEADVDLDALGDDEL